MPFSSQSVKPVAQAISAQARLSPLASDEPVRMTFQQIRARVAWQQGNSLRRVENNRGVQALEKAVTRHQREVALRAADRMPWTGDDEVAYHKWPESLEASLREMTSEEHDDIRDALQSFGRVLGMDTLERFLRARISPDGDQQCNPKREEECEPQLSAGCRWPFYWWPPVQGNRRISPRSR